MDKELKSKWSCPGCRVKVKKGDNTNTPIQPKTLEQRTCSEAGVSADYYMDSDAFDNVTQRKKLSSNQSSLSIEPELLSVIRSEIQSSIRGSLRSAVELALGSDISAIKDELRILQDLKTSIDFLSSEYDRMKSDIQSSEEKIRNLSKDNTTLKSKVDELSGRLNLLVQHARETNVEINGIPEHKSENLVSVFKQLSSAVSRPIADTNILSCTRVRKMDDYSQRPRAIVVKLPGTAIRDEILAAVAKFNKATPSEKLHSGHLGYGGKKSPIFVSEHLAPYYKALHTRTRHVARDKDYKYVWIRNGRIFVRKNDQSPAKQIKSYENLNNL
ncbi:uncharacterized protein LOC113235379 [Hyposmocoma kahamanoa]|uniref:uncharacterized protein LOC113235379 n=1 Tax=Hyposmocoma kahamanoa TaxID=1477025 RepID=UPI000E6D80D7|nr:uncharacterized protein LOC113235379 [Hyposmocoma kahamanoa]